jgi:hypothetical protein
LNPDALSSTPNRLDSHFSLRQPAEKQYDVIEYSGRDCSECGRNEIVGGLWILMINLISIQQSMLARWLSVTGIVTGLAGILTLIPALEAMAVLFGFGCIVWFGGLSVALMNHPEAA